MAVDYIHSWYFRDLDSDLVVGAGDLGGGFLYSGEGKIWQDGDLGMR